jgi:hypothetical protein
MAVINTADKIYAGASLASKAYQGTVQVWPPVSAFETETAAWESAVVAAGGAVSSGRKTTVDTLIKGLKTDGVWTKLERLWLFAAENGPSSWKDLTTASNASLINSPSFTTDRGYTGNGTNAYIDSNFNLSTATKFVQNSACIFAWSNTSGAEPKAIAGTGNTVNTIYPNYGGTSYMAVNSTANTQDTAPGSVGLFSITRSGSNATAIYYNGGLIVVGADPSSPPVNSNLLFLSESSTFTARQVCCGGAGAHLTATDQSNLYNKLRTYMTAVGVP